MKIFLAIGLSLVAGTGCKKNSGAAAGGDSDIRSVVAIQVPQSVVGKVTKARLTADLRGNSITLKPNRVFEELVQASASGSTGISFQRDNSTEQKPIKVDDNLYAVTLDLVNGDKVIYSGPGSINPFIIKLGENRISFALACKDTSVCPTGSNLEVVQVQGVSADPASAPKILADIIIADQGTSIPQRRAAFAGCQTEIRKKTCDEWQADTTVPDGSDNCKAILAQKPDEICENKAKIYGYYCLDDIIEVCKKMGRIK